MRALTLRVPDYVHVLIAEEASRHGVSVSRYMSDAALGLLAYERSKRGASEEAEKVFEIIRSQRQN